MARLLKRVGDQHSEIDPASNASDLLMPLSLSGAGEEWSRGLSSLANVLRREGSKLTSEDTKAAAHANAAARLHPYTRPWRVPNLTQRHHIDLLKFQVDGRAIALPERVDLQEGGGWA